jgi:hypothetical protein
MKQDKATELTLVFRVDLIEIERDAIREPTGHRNETVHQEVVELAASTSAPGRPASWKSCRFTSVKSRHFARSRGSPSGRRNATGAILAETFEGAARWQRVPRVGGAELRSAGAERHGQGHA